MGILAIVNGNVRGRFLAEKLRDIEERIAAKTLAWKDVYVFLRCRCKSSGD